MLESYLTKSEISALVRYHRADTTTNGPQERSQAQRRGPIGHSRPHDERRNPKRLIRALLASVARAP
jgi:hypothetical protein